MNEMLKFKEFLKDYHTGQEKAITKRELVTALGIDERDVRQFTNTLRTFGTPICSCQRGYFYGETVAEIDSTIFTMSSRIREMQKAVNGLKDSRKSLEVDI